jgi:predicted nucleotidyltransferase
MRRLTMSSSPSGNTPVVVRLPERIDRCGAPCVSCLSAHLLPGPMLDPDALLMRLDALLQEVPVRFGVLYGSYAAGRPTPVSDLDVAVYADTHDAFREAVRALTEAFPEVRVDVVNLADQPALLYYEVLASGIPVAVRDDAFFAREKLRVMREYLDFQPMHRRLLDDMGQRLRDGTYGTAALTAQGRGNEPG